MIRDFIFNYICDTFIYNKHNSEYLKYFKAVLQYLRDKLLKVKYTKQKFVIDTIKYLGYIISKGKE